MIMKMNIKKGFAAILMAAALLLVSQGCHWGHHGWGHGWGHGGHHYYHH